MNTVAIAILLALLVTVAYRCHLRRVYARQVAVRLRRYV